MSASKRHRGLARRLERRPLLLAAAALVISLAAAVAMADVAGLAQVRAVLERISPVWLAVAAAARVAAYFGYTLGHHRVMGACEDSEIEVDTAARVVAFGAGATSLRGGFSIDARALRGAGASPRRARAHVVALAMFEYAVLAAAAWIAALLLLGGRHGQDTVVWPWVIGVPAGVAVAAGAYLGVSRFLAVRRRKPGPRLRSLLQGGEILAGQSQRPVRAVTAAAGMALYWAAEITALWCSLRAFGVTASPVVVIVGCATGYVLTPRGLPLAGAGIAEVLVPFALHWLGIPLATAVAAVFAAELTRLVVSVPFVLGSRGPVQELVDSAP